MKTRNVSKIHKALAALTLLFTFTIGQLPAQISGSDLVKAFEQSQKGTTLPSYKGSNDSLYNLMKSQVKLLHVHPVHHKAMLDLDKKGNVTKAEIICQYGTCEFHPKLVEALTTHPWIPAKVKSKTTAVRAFTVNLVPPYDLPPPTFEPSRVNVSAEPEIFTIVEEQAEYPGGNDTLKRRAVFKYPLTCNKDTATMSCKVYLKFVVNEDGSCSDCVLLKGCKNCADADQQALIFFAEMPAWKPARMRGKTVKSYYNLPVVFKK